jgi:hypothetical protein
MFKFFFKKVFEIRLSTLQELSRKFFPNFAVKYELKILIMRNIFFFLSFLFHMGWVFAQSEILFEKTSHNFGSIKEENGPVSYVFKFRNNGSTSVKLVDVKASCGCTTPEWSKDDVLPSAEGYITATYDPKGRPGKFDKSITVRTSGTPSILTLQISGEVIPRPKGPEDWYPSLSGNLRMQTDYIFFGDVFNDQIDTASTIFYNASEKPMTIYWERLQLPAHLKAIPANGKSTIEPSESLKVNFEFDAKLKNDWGYVFDVLNFETDDEAQPRKRLSFSADIKENFSHLTESDKKPKIEFDKLEHNFGEVIQNTQSTTTFVIRNTGDATLLIRKCKASCGCTASQPRKMSLLPGESTTIDVSYSSGSQEGSQNKTITIISNDPKQPQVNLSVKAHVLKSGTK